MTVQAGRFSRRREVGGTTRVRESGEITDGLSAPTEPVIVYESSPEEVARKFCIALECRCGGDIANCEEAQQTIRDVTQAKKKAAGGGDCLPRPPRPKSLGRN